MRPSLVIVLAAAGALLSACAESHAGFSCDRTSFSSDDCRARVAAAKCADGGVEARGLVDAGTATLCCVWDECQTTPYPPPAGP